MENCASASPLSARSLGLGTSAEQEAKTAININKVIHRREPRAGLVMILTRFRQGGGDLRVKSSIHHVKVGADDIAVLHHLYIAKDVRNLILVHVRAAIAFYNQIFGDGIV